MASLIRSMRGLTALKQSAGYMSVMQRRLESSKPPFPAAVDDNLKKPLEKPAEDPLADPKESCNTISIHFLNKFIIRFYLQFFY